MTATGQMRGLGQGPSIPPNTPPNHTEGSSKPTTFQIIAQLALPLVLAAIAFFQPMSWWFWGLVALAFVPVAPRIYRPLKRKVSHRWARHQDNRRARQDYPEFRRLVARFSEFVDVNASDKLTDIIESELRRRSEIDVTKPEDLEVTPERVFHGFWEDLQTRSRHMNPDRESLAITVREFNHLLNQYLKETVRPAFDRMPQDVRSSLPDRAKRQLEAFRERLNEYLKDYEDFATRLADSFETAELDEPYLPRPEPHT